MAGRPSAAAPCGEGDSQTQGQGPGLQPAKVGGDTEDSQIPLGPQGVTAEDGNVEIVTRNHPRKSKIPVAGFAY